MLPGYHFMDMLVTSLIDDLYSPIYWQLIGNDVATHTLSSFPVLVPQLRSICRGYVLESVRDSNSKNGEGPAREIQ
jgi:hypothetical protein